MRDNNIFKAEKGVADDVEEQLTGGCFMVPATALAVLAAGFLLNYLPL